MGETDVPFEAWYRALHARLLASLILITGNGEIARDATDEAFARAYQHWSRVSRMTSPKKRKAAADPDRPGEPTAAPGTTFATTV